MRATTQIRNRTAATVVMVILAVIAGCQMNGNSGLLGLFSTGTGGRLAPRIFANPSSSNPLMVTLMVDLGDYPSAARINWDYGDGSRATNLSRAAGATLTHSYLRPGSFEVMVFLFDANGNSVAANTVDLTVQAPTTPTRPGGDDDGNDDGSGGDDDDDDGTDGENDGPMQVRLRTNLGDIVLDLKRSAAPKTVANFLAYVEAGEYNNVVFHRVVSDFVIQGGGFRSLGAGNSPRLEELPTRPAIESEANNGFSNTRGFVAMALRGSNANSGTNQFFINLGDNSSLDNGTPPFTVFAEVISGMDVVDRIANVAVDRFEVTTDNGAATFDDVPVEDVTILEATRVVTSS